jgi:transaldolase
MKLWIESSSVAEAEPFAVWGVLAGATTSRAGLAADARPRGAVDEAIVGICDLLDASVIVELPLRGDDLDLDAERLVADGAALAALHESAIAGLPCSAAGLIAVSALAERELPVAVTHVFSAAQALLAAEAGAALVVTSVARMEEAAVDAGDALQAIVESLHGGESTTELLVGGIRTPQQAVLAARLGADSAAIPAAVLRRMLEHPLTHAEIERARTP